MSIVTFDKSVKGKASRIRIGENYVVVLCFLWRSHVYFDPITVYMKRVELATIRIRTDQIMLIWTDQISIHPSSECDDEARPRQQALQCDDYGRSYGFSDPMIDFCVVKVFVALLETKKKFLKLTKCPWEGNEYIPNKQRFTFLLETENASLCC